MAMLTAFSYVFLSSPSCGDIINVVTAHKSLCFYSVPSAGDIFSSSDIMMDSMFLFSPLCGGHLSILDFGLRLHVSIQSPMRGTFSYCNQQAKSNPMFLSGPPYGGHCRLLRLL